MLRARYHFSVIGKGAVGDKLRSTPRLQRIVANVTACGPRPVGELLIEAMEGAGADPAALESLLARWESLDPRTVAAVGGRDFPRPPLRIVPSRERER